MSNYGSDKPDLRFEMKLIDFTRRVGNERIQAICRGRQIGGVIKGLVAVGQAGLSRKQLDEIEQEAKLAGASGLAWVAFGDEDQIVHQEVP